MCGQNGTHMVTQSSIIFHLFHFFAHFFLLFIELFFAFPPLVIMPPDALEELGELSNSRRLKTQPLPPFEIHFDFYSSFLFFAILPKARLHIQYPMMFQLENKDKSRVSHCGVLEFVAEPGTIYLPGWVSNFCGQGLLLISSLSRG